jgi:PAS domain S-box-containing protein
MNRSNFIVSLKSAFLPISVAGLWILNHETISASAKLAEFSFVLVLIFGSIYYALTSFHSKHVAQLASLESEKEKASRAAKMYHEILDAIPDPLLIKDRQHRYVLVNQELANLLGVTKDEMIGKNDYDFLPKYICDVYWNKEEEVFSTLRVNENKEEIIDSHGHFKTILTKKTPMRDENGDLVVLGLIRDITERENEAKKLEESERRYRLLADHASDMISIHYPDGRFSYVSPICDKLLGYKQEELIGKSSYAFIDPETVDYVTTQHMALLSGPAVVTYQYRFLKKDGSYLWFETISQTRRGINGDVEQIFSISRDISEKKRVEHLIHEQQQKFVFASKMSALGEMAGNIAHEVNNPLSVILGRASQLRRFAERGSLSDAVLKDNLEKIESTSQRIAKIIRGLRSFSRNGENDPFVAAKVKTLLDETLELCGERLNAQNIKVNLAAIPEDAELICRPVQISQVLLNLFNNSSDAIQALSDKWIQVGFCGMDSYFEIQIMDSGPGIKPGIADKIMQPFFTTKEVGKGTGLGLSISRMIVEEHGGELLLDRKCSNTRFVIRLPKNASQSPTFAVGTKT